MKLEQVLHQILANKIACKVLDDILYITPMTPDQKLLVYHQHQEIVREAELEGILTDSEMEDLLIKNGLWSTEEETELSGASIRMDGLKEEMYRYYEGFKSGQVEKLRHLLTRLRMRSGELFRKKHSYDLYTCSGLASMNQLHFMLINNTILPDGRRLKDINPDDIYIRILSEQYAVNRPSDNDIRQAAKLDMWRSIWHSAKGATSVFGLPASDLSEEQRSLIGWSRLNDNISESVEPPDKVVLEDDDLLDGWLLVQHKKREAEKKEKDSGGSKRPGAQEVYIPADTSNDAARIDSMNSVAAQLTKKQRARMLERNGVVSQEKMPDSQRQMLMEATQAFHDRMRSN